MIDDTKKSEGKSHCHINSCPSHGDKKELCPACDRVIQDFKDDIELLEDAIEYLKKSKIFNMS